MGLGEISFLHGRNVTRPRPKKVKSPIPTRSQEPSQTHVCTPRRALAGPRHSVADPKGLWGASTDCRFLTIGPYMAIPKKDVKGLKTRPHPRKMRCGNQNHSNPLWQMRHLIRLGSVGATMPFGGTGVFVEFLICHCPLAQYFVRKSMVVMGSGVDFMIFMIFHGRPGLSGQNQVFGTYLLSHA